MIEVRDLVFAYGKGGYIFDGFNIEIPSKEISVIMGPNGCGKTTLLKLIAGILRPLRGRISIDGEDPEVYRVRGLISLVFQDHGLLPWMRVWDNVALPLRIRGFKRGLIEKMVRSSLERVGMLWASQRYPGTLSGGERQRIALARALASGARVLLLDEPLASVDPEARDDLISLIKSIWHEERQTVVVVTHSPEDAARLGGNIYVIGGRPARLLSTIPLGKGGGDDDLDMCRLVEDIKRSIRSGGKP
ncbi:MAG: ATP-binding cassette domain-containing protein [Sulfolobales archaeon]